MVKDTVDLAIVFADISGSTVLYEKMGDTAARAHVSTCLAMMMVETEANDGTVIKTIGDEIMCTFPDVEKAVAAIMSMQVRVTANGGEDATPDKPSMAIRAGFHFGPTILEAGDVFGDAVNVAARMAGLAKAGQIITTRATAEALPPHLQKATRHLDRIPVKGKAREIDIYEVLWQVDDVTRMATDLLRTRTSTARLTLTYQGRPVDLDPDLGSFVLGRSADADMVVSETRASRMHAKIECRRGKFVLTDMSTNGTYLQCGEQKSYLRREETVLTGEGRIGLGRQLDETTDVVTFVATG